LAGAGGIDLVQLAPQLAETGVVDGSGKILHDS
jgi:hypothetical protein